MDIAVLALNELGAKFSGFDLSKKVYILLGWQKGPVGSHLGIVTVMRFCGCWYKVVFMLLLGVTFFACSNSEYLYTDNDVASLVETGEAYSAQSALSVDYPYAGIPRLFIETEDNVAVRDRETEIPAKMWIGNESFPDTDAMELTIRGRGNSSWLMPQKSYKLEFSKKQSLLGMPKDRDWALVSNYVDKSLMKNYLMYRLSNRVGAYYAPRCEFVELFLNREYLGVYLLTETIKKSKSRVSLPQNENSYIVEVDGKYRKEDQVIFLKVLKDDAMPFRVHEPRKASEESLDALKDYLRNFEKHLKTVTIDKDNDMRDWIDVDEYVRHFWLQEFPKNPDAAFYTSVYFTWTRNGVITMGPVWDFDLAFGGHRKQRIKQVENWHVKNSYWNAYAFMDPVVRNAMIHFWERNKTSFMKLLTDADSVYNVLEKAAENNFKRWKILKRVDDDHHFVAYDSYKDAVEDLKEWIGERYFWIETAMQKEALSDVVVDPLDSLSNPAL